MERLCQLLDKGFQPCDIMILVRSASDGARVAAELLDFKQRNRDPRYRFDVMTQEALIIGKAPVSSFVAAALRLCVDGGDSSARAIYNRYLGRPFDAPLDGAQQAFFRAARLLSPEEAFERIVLRHDLQHDRTQTAYLQAFHEQIIAFCNNRIADIALFLGWWEEQGAARSLSVERSRSAVEITTIHKAKGLERRAVLIPYCSWPLDPRAGVRQIVWAQADDRAADVGDFPVRYSSTMAASEFSGAYWREWVYTHVDNINLLYVALTRAAESLHVFVPRRGQKHVGSLLVECLRPDCEAGLCQHTELEAGERFEYGLFAGPVDEGRESAAAERVILDDYSTAQADLRLRLPSQRYFEESDSPQLAPRDFGILMHRAFERASSREEIDQAVRRMEQDGVIAAAEAGELRRQIDRALTDPRVGEWFGGAWDRVLLEQEIVVPGESSTRRPDRVMLAGRRAVVVDYKFGTKDPASYRQQISRYMALLRGMGYTRVEGYLWYVRLGKIEKVDTDEKNS